MPVRWQPLSYPSRSVMPGSNASSSIPISATYPRQLIVYDDPSNTWNAIDDSTEENRRKLQKLEYLAVSYRWADFPDKPMLEETVQSICKNRDLYAYWLDFACTGKTQEEKNQDLYRIADVFRFAKETVIMIPDVSGVGWKSWGGRVWTYPEALLSEKHICKEGNSETRKIRLNEIYNLAYDSSEGEQRLAALYGMGGRDFARFRDRVQDLCFAVWTRNSGPGESPSTASSSQLTALPGERVYALMGFLQKRIVPNPNESEGQAFDRLMDVNGLECNLYPWEALRTGTEFVVHDAQGDTEFPTAILKGFNVGAAKYNNSRCAVKATCVAGTRASTLNSIYEWLDQDSTTEEENKRRVFWMYGLAGTGKSTIAKTVAEHCDRKNILGATYFCSRFNSECSNKLSIFSAISHQLCQHDDALKRAVLEALKQDNDLGSADIRTQLEKLIVKPLQAVKRAARYAIIIDALDECSDDSSISDLLQALDEYINELTPLKFIVSSRPEDNIRRGFLSLDLSAHLNQQNLGSISSTEVNMDIRIYLKQKLRLISFNLKVSWPTDVDIEAIVDRSDGLFIFASTTVKFLEDKKFSNPVGLLKQLLESTAPASDTSPHAMLDKLYLSILEGKFKDADESLLAKLRWSLKILIAADAPLTIEQLEVFMPDIHAIFQDLHSLVFIPDKEHEVDINSIFPFSMSESDQDAERYVRFIHSSFRDFLLDGKRCTNRFLIERPDEVIVRCCTDVVIQLLEARSEIQDLIWDTSDLFEDKSFFGSLKTYLGYQEAEEAASIEYVHNQLERSFNIFFHNRSIRVGIYVAHCLFRNGIYKEVAEMLSEKTSTAPIQPISGNIERVGVQLGLAKPISLRHRLVTFNGYYKMYLDFLFLNAEIYALWILSYPRFALHSNDIRKLCHILVLRRRRQVHQTTDR